MNKIEIAIIGTQKSGTSSLNKYLALHPEFVTHSSLEFPYFVNDELYHKGYEHAMGEYFDNSELNSKIIIKSVGIIYDEEALRRLKDHNPDVKIIITLRHPVDRAYSAYWYACRYGWEKEPSFEKSLWQKSQQENWIGNRFCDYINRSEYSKHIKTVYDHFPERQVFVLLAEDLRNNPEQMCIDIMEYFHFAPQIRLPKVQHHNSAAMPRIKTLSVLLSDRNPIKRYLRYIIPVKTGRKIKNMIRNANEKDFKPPKMSPNTRKILLDHFQPFNKELAQMINKDLSLWNR